MTANNATLTSNVTVDEIYLQTVRGSNTVEKVYREGDEGYDTARAVLDLAGDIPNPIGKLQEKNAQLGSENREIKNRNATLTAENAKQAESIQKLNARIDEQKKQIAKLITGKADEELTDGLIALYPEWQLGLSVDSGDAYRIGNVLYIAKRDHVTNEETRPDKDTNAEYWMGENNLPEEPKPNPKYKYPKGTEVEYQGVMYYATVDTNDGPEVGYPTWVLAANKPSGV